MKIKFWGTRGSIPTPSTTNFVTSRYGGNTTCATIRIPGQIIVIDGGSGLRNVGLELAREMPLHATFFFTHVHWDHIQGFPFFIPAFVAGNTFDLYGPRLNRHPGFVGSILEKALRGQQEDLNFPVQLTDMPAKMNFSDIDNGNTITLKGTESEITITPAPLVHPGGCFGYRFEETKSDGSKSIFVFATDTEHSGENDKNIQLLSKGATAMLYDAQFTEDEYEGRVGISRKGWGHSTWNRGLMEAEEAGIKRLLLTHHDPLHDDWAVARIENDARKEGLKMGIEVDAAYEGMELEI